MLSSKPGTRRRVVLAVAGIAAAGVLGYGGWRSMGRREAGPDTVLPAFEEPKPGPRAPRTEALGVSLGVTRLPEVERSIGERSLTCKDTSARALMKGMREAREKADAEKLARGEEVDATTSASSKKVNAREKNPQVRLSCESTHAASLGDRVRQPGTGRLLYIFDSPEHPLRHVSYRRIHRDQRAALADAEDALRGMTEIFGPPATTTGRLPVAGAAAAEGEGAPLFEKYAPFKATWSWSDLTVTVSALSYGARGVDVYEAVEVPWPVRPDAPALGRPELTRAAPR